MVSVPFYRSFVQRIVPKMPAQAYKTYGWSQPARTHFRPATCDEVDCDAYRNGWVTTVDLSTDLGQRQYEYITHDRTRGCSMQRVSMTLVKFVFRPGNRCFRSGDHKLPVGRPATLYVAEGDWRGNPRGIPVRVHRTPENWVEDFALHQDRLATVIQRG